MVLRRSGSAKSTLSMIAKRATKYQKFLNLSNVFLLIASTILVFSAVILIKFYHIDKLDFWSTYFMIVPLLMIVLGVYTFIVCVYGFLISGSERRLLLVIYALLLCIAFFAQLASIFTALELRTTVAGPTVTANAVNEDLRRYGIDSGITSKWDDLQEDMQCCGGSNFDTGYTDYRNTPIGRNSSVPDSCCHTPTPGCGKDIFRENEENVRTKIFVHGCITMLKNKLDNDVIPMMIVYAVIGVILALVEMITIVLASAFVAQIGRKRRREEKMFRHGNAGADYNDDVTDALNHETVC